MDNLIAIATWWTSLLWRTSHFERVSCGTRGLCSSAGSVADAQCLIAAERHITETNKNVFNAAGLDVLSPRDLALQFVSCSALIFCVLTTSWK